MKDRRVSFFRGHVELLLEALEATVRIDRWTSAEAIPEPLRKSASQLVERLSIANRLAADKYAGPAAVQASLSAMIQAVQRLDAAYVQYRQRVDTAPRQQDAAALQLESEIGAVKSDANDWAPL